MICSAAVPCVKGANWHCACDQLSAGFDWQFWASGRRTWPAPWCEQRRFPKLERASKASTGELHSCPLSQWTCPTGTRRFYCSWAPTCWRHWPMLEWVPMASTRQKWSSALTADLVAIGPAIQNRTLSDDTCASVSALLSISVAWCAPVELANPASRAEDRMIPRLTHSWTRTTLACPRRIQ